MFLLKWYRIGWFVYIGPAISPEQFISEHFFLYLIAKKGEKPSAIYLELGFEDLSHFAFAFKKMFGVTPAVLMKK